MANIVVSALSTFNNKGLKKGKKEIGIFEKQVKSFAKTFVAAFSVTALTRFSKTAVKAFMADEKAAKSLEQQLKNTGFQFSAPGVELYIANLQKATGVLDDELRPAFQQLLTVTGSITTSQEALNTAMNVSAATGRSLSQVTTALSRAYAGNTTGLSRLGAGLDKALLKAGNMDAIMAELNSKFAGQAQARLSTYAGQMDLLRVASENAKEEIGEGLLLALQAIGKDNSIDEVTRKMENLGKSTGKTIEGLGVLIGQIKSIPGAKTLGDIVFGTNIFNMLNKLAQENSKGRFPTAPARETPAQGRILAAQRKQEAKNLKETNRLRTAEVNALKKKTAVDMLKDQFDIERIGFTKALNEATDKEIKLRLQAQIAILDNNEALAKKILAELAAAETAKKMAEDMAKSAAALEAAFQATIARLMIFDPLKSLRPTEADILATLGALAGGTRTPGGGGGMAAPLTPYNPLSSLTVTTQDLAATGFRYDPLSGMRVTEQDIRITIDTSGSGDKLSQAIAESIQIATRSGYSITPAGFL
jgi:uncharacterized protein with GYD domain